MINISSLNLKIEDVAARGPVFFQEHLVPECKHRATHAAFAKLQRSAQLSPTEPDAGRQSGGVGAAAPRDTPPVRPRLMTPGFRAAHKLGRADLTLLKLNATTTILVFNVYLWQGSQTSGPGRDRGDALLAAVIDEIRAQPGCRCSSSATSTLTANATLHLPELWRKGSSPTLEPTVHPLRLTHTHASRRAV